MWVCPKLKLTPRGDHTTTDTTSLFVEFFLYSSKRYVDGQI